MWIRSQDKKDLVPIGDSGYYPSFDEQTGCSILACRIGEGLRVGSGVTSGIWLGNYANKKRCMQILDEIERHITVDIRDPYHMPEK